MGYYSDFEFWINKKELSLKQQIEVLDFIENDENLSIITSEIELSKYKDENAYKECKLLPEDFNIYEKKWYDYQEDLLRLSKQFPYLKIEVERSGEEIADIEKTWFYNGQMQTSMVRFVFDENKLW